MKFQYIAAVLALALLPSCTSSTPTDRSKPFPQKPAKAPLAVKTAVHMSGADMQQLENAIKQHLKDPYSAMFSNVTAATKGGLISICGLVNAKNSYGGYTGSQLFYTSAFRSKSGALEIGPVYINDLVAANMSRDYCL